MANHNFNITLAKRYGIEEAILIEHIYWWIHKNECEEVEDMMQDGRVWCRSTAKGFAKYIPYMKPDKIWRILKKLEGNVLMVGNFNKQALNQTLWYTFTDDFVKELKGLNYDFEKIKNAILKNEKSNNIINNILIEDNIIEDSKKRDNNKLSSLKKDDIEFDEFYKLYPLKKSKQCAVKVWNKLSVEDKKEAIDKLPTYIADCYENKRSFKYPSTYLSQRTWEDDFISSDEKEEPTEETQYPAGMDAEQWNEITFWMCNKVPKIAGKINPVTFDTMKKMAKDSQLLSMVLKEVDYRFTLDSSLDVMEVFKEKLKNYRDEQTD